jgi:hypothetical protein
MHPRNTEAAERYRERQQRENEAPRLADEVPGLDTLRLSISFKNGDGSAMPSHARVVVVQRAPALFWVPCANKDCKHGGYEITQPVLSALKQHKTTFTGAAHCSGETANGSLCTGELQFEGTATYR